MFGLGISMFLTAKLAAYTLLAAVGALDAQTLRLRVNIYDPSDHYNLVKDKWFGLRTPDGR